MAQLTSILQSSFSRRLLPIYVLWGALHHENIICRMIVWEWHTVYAQLSRSFLATPAAIWWSGAVFPTIGSVISHFGHLPFRTKVRLRLDCYLYQLLKWRKTKINLRQQQLQRIFLLLTLVPPIGLQISSLIPLNLLILVMADLSIEYIEFSKIPTPVITLGSYSIYSWKTDSKQSSADNSKQP